MIEERKRLQALLRQRLDSPEAAARAAAAAAAAAAAPQQPAPAAVTAAGSGSSSSSSSGTGAPGGSQAAVAAPPPAAPQAPSAPLTPAPGTRPSILTFPRTPEAPARPVPSPAAAAPAPPVQQAPPPPPTPAVSQYQAPAIEEPPPKPVNPNAMNVIMALPKALAARGHRVMVIAPRYKQYDDAWETGVRHRIRVFDAEQEIGYFHAYQDGVDYVFVDHPSYHHWAHEIYGGSRSDIMFRCALLSKAALEAPWTVPCGGAPYGDSNLVFIANDWHTALVPVYLQAHYRDHGKMQFARSVFVLHNVAHQGRAPMDDLQFLEIPEHYRELFRLDDPIGGEHMNVLKAGAITAHRIVAVSHGYAWECKTQEGGWGLDAIFREQDWKLRGAAALCFFAVVSSAEILCEQDWKLEGVVNGIDYREWSPAVDPFLSSDGYANYDMTTMAEGKAKCKAALQKELGLPVNPNVPLLGFIGRLDYQKGVDLINDNYDWLMSEGCQLVMLGSGREDLESQLRNMESRNHDKCRGWVGFSVKMAHRITAGCDMLLMPSRFEPCGLNQLYAMAYGTVPVVHAVGGLRDTVKPFNPFENAGTGWTFDHADAGNFRKALGDALYTFREHRQSFRGCQLRGMDQDLSWDHAAEQYEEVLLAAKYQW
ncbi:hypothetical protein N2152v2_003280 [Parachlorella kessleri]